MSKKESWPIGEFVSFELEEDEYSKEFTIILKGKLKYSDLIASKIDEIVITKKDMEDHRQ